MKLYGSLNNRLEENKDSTNGNIEVGTYATEYLYSDRHAYEINATLSLIEEQEQEIERRR